MSLSKHDSTQLWDAVAQHDLAAYAPVFSKLLRGPLRHLPLRVYLPAEPSAAEAGHLRVVQALVAPGVPGTGEAVTLGSALHGVLPALFPSRRTPILARPVLHGAVVPMGAVLEELVRGAAYLDGWVHLGVVMMG
ncbi:Autophagy-related protein 5 [Lasallia pustulata]|uniref:Autophagy protein 5 n=1 Tax=Lasallia pustulata TaxID=136370 RepID=A0A1W5CZA5_9LECA|nr:Autophagy-related protein 5 [Lasallia pustulata]